MAKYIELTSKADVKSCGTIGANSLFNSHVQPKQEKADDKKNVSKNTELKRNHI